MIQQKNKIIAVIITYNPDYNSIQSCIQSLSGQVDKIIIVDNNSSSKLDLININPMLDIIYLDANYGIAYAQNIGIKKAIENKADFVLTSDQDTTYPKNYIEALMSCFKEKSESYKIASISPVYTDQNKENALQPMVYFKNGLLIKDYSLEECKSVSHVISSGMLIPIDALNNIGLMDEKLFIDWVDTEWCWRAIGKGFEIIQTPNITIHHCLGNPSSNILGKQITVHNSLRNYYKIRNAAYLLFYSDSLSFPMKFFTLQQILKMMIVHPLTSNKIIEEIFVMFKGLKDGLFSKMGMKNEYN
jgi:rhamnosyltransferase